MSPTTESESPGVTVRILDKDYQFGCQPQEKEGLLASARFLDERMREVRKSGRVIGTDRIAVVAAVNLAYDLLQKGRDDAGLGHATPPTTGPQALHHRDKMGFMLHLQAAPLADAGGTTG